MSLQLLTDSDDEFFSNPFRALLNPRYFGPSLLTAPNTSLNAPCPIKLDVVEVTLIMMITKALLSISREFIYGTESLKTLQQSDSEKEESKSEAIKPDHAC